MDTERDDVPRYKKKKAKKTPVKSDHKHESANCVFEVESIRFDKIHGIVPATRLVIGTYCPICGRIRSSWNEAYWTPGDRLDTGAWRSGHWSEEAEKEFDPETRTLPFFQIKDFFTQKYVE